MKIILLSIFLAFLFTLARAQSTSKTNNKTVYGELGGPGFFSANFDTRFTHKPTGLSARVGLGYAPVLLSSVLAVPVGVNYLAGKNRHFFEAEAGASLIHMFASKDDGWWSTDASSGWIKYVYAGYRYKSPDGFTFRVGFCPLFGEGEAVPWVGIGVGGSF